MCTTQTGRNYLFPWFWFLCYILFKWPGFTQYSIFLRKIRDHKHNTELEDGFYPSNPTSKDDIWLKIKYVWIISRITISQKISSNNITMWYFFSVADGASLYRPEENFLFPYDNFVRKYPSLLTMSTTLTTSFFSIWNAIRPSISHPEVTRPAISQQVPSITDISPPLHHPQETVEKDQQIQRGIFVAMCFEIGWSEKVKSNGKLSSKPIETGQCLFLAADRTVHWTRQYF